jgi:hypothetical protein
VPASCARPCARRRCERPPRARQAYKYSQRPALPAERPQGPDALVSHCVPSMPVGPGGRARPTLFPLFPQARPALAAQVRSPKLQSALP